MSAIKCPSPGLKLYRSLPGSSCPKLSLPRRAPSTSQRRAFAGATGTQPSSSGDDRVVEQTRTYNESEGKLYSKSVPAEDDEGSIALLVPGGRVSDRPSQAGGAVAAARREQNKPLKINTDLQLYRARQKGIAAKLLPASTEKLRKAQQVEQELRTVLARDPTDERTYVLLGTFLLRQRRIREARSVYEEGCAVAEGKNAYIWTAMANLERKEGKYAPARKYYQAAVTADDTHSAAYHGWGELEKRAGRMDAARNVLLQGVRQTTADPSPYLFVSLANLAIRTGLVGEARYWLREGTNTKRGAASNALWTTWGNMEWKQAGDAKAAAYCFDMALRNHRRSRYAFLSYAMMEKALGNVTSARQLLRRGAQLNPTDAPLRQAYGVMLAEDQQYRAARQQFKAAASADEYHLPVWQAWAVMELKLKDYERARQLFQRGVWAAPKDPNLVWLWQAWGCMEAELGNLPQARGLFKAAIGLAPDNDAVWEAWIKMEEDNDLLDRANALRSHRFEAAERDALPPSFTTLPPEGGAVIGTVKKWMRRFIQSEGPSTVYTPPPGRSPEDAVRDASESSQPREPWDPTPQRRSRKKRIVVQSVDSATTARIAEAAGAEPAGAASTGPAADTVGPEGAPAVPRDRAGGAANGAGVAGQAAPDVWGGVPEARTAEGREASADGVAGDVAGAASQAGAAQLNGKETGRSGEGGQQRELGALPKPARGRSQSVSGRIVRPRWRGAPGEGGRGGPAAATASSNGTLEERKDSVWAGEWSVAGMDEPGVGLGDGLDRPGPLLADAVGEQNGKNSNGSNGRNGGSSEDLPLQGGSVSIADGPGSETVVR